MLRVERVRELVRQQIARVRGGIVRARARRLKGVDDGGSAHHDARKRGVAREASR